MCATPGMASFSTPGLILTGGHPGQCRPQHDVFSGQCSKPIQAERLSAGGRKGLEGPETSG